MVERAVGEAEIIGGGEDSVGGGTGIDGQDAVENVRLAIVGDDVVENGEDVGLLGEILEGGVVGDQAALGTPAPASDSARRFRALSRSRWPSILSPMAFSRSAACSSAPR